MSLVYEYLIRLSHMSVLYGSIMHYIYYVYYLQPHFVLYTKHLYTKHL